MTSVFLYIPNLIGYGRLILLLLAWILWEWPGLCIVCYACAAILDAVDGWAARRFNQSSAFGAWLDVVIDNLARSMLWSGIFSWGWMVSALEWCVFSITHMSGPEWKTDFDAAPHFVKMVMAKGFKQPAGVLAMAGSHAFPIVHYGVQRQVLLPLMPVIRVAWASLIVGRVLCGAVEIWCVYNYIRRLAAQSKTA